jgi:GAF domain-containing protein
VESGVAIVDAEKLAEAFVELADTMVDDFDVLDLLHVLATRCVDLLDAAAAGLLLTENGSELQLVVSSSERAQLVELFQLQHDEGPCVDCFHSGESVSNDRLDQAQTRWPTFAPAATNAGFVSVIALPMRLRGQVIGALNLFGTTDSAPISEQHIRIAQAMADTATIAILQDRLARSRSVVNEQLQVALNSRITIEQAKGVLSARLGISVDEAFEALRSHARSTRRKLTEVAEEVAQGNSAGIRSSEHSDR